MTREEAMTNEAIQSYTTPIQLMGRRVALAPLALEHTPDLFVALNHDAELWAYLPARMPGSVTDMASWVETALEMQRQGQRVPFAVLDNACGRAIGSTSYLDLSEEHRHVEIGWTWYARPSWRTVVNTECKYLLLRHAFEMLGCIRVQLRTDLRNERSQRAIERIGGVREGTLRHLQILHDGHRRSVVFYSLLAEEWPARKAWFEETLNN
jgi:RimJ/RimL family protein N-acetyltransferase